MILRNCIKFSGIVLFLNIGSTKAYKFYDTEPIKAKIKDNGNVTTNVNNNEWYHKIFFLEWKY